MIIGWLAGGGILGLLARGGPEPLTQTDLAQRWLSLVWGLWMAGTFVAVQAAAGAWLAGLVRRPTRQRRAMLLAQLVVIGSFASCSVLLVLVAAGAAWPVTGLAYLALLVPAAAMGTPRLLALRPWVCMRRSAQRWRGSWVGWACAIGIIVWAAPYLVQALLPNSDWDSAAYHLPLARLLHQGNFWQVDPVYWWYAQPGSMHLLFGLFDRLGAAAAIVPYNLLMAALSALLVYQLGRLLGGRTAARLACLIYLTQNLIFEVAITPRIDSLAATWFLAGIAALAAWSRRPRQTGHLLILGLAMGLSLGSKQINLILVALAAAAAACHLLRRGWPAPQQLRAATLAALLAVVPAGLWHLRCTIATGDPIYPAWRGEVVRDESGQIWRRPQIVQFISQRLPPEQFVQSALKGTEFEEAAMIARRSADAAPRLTAFWDAVLAPSRHQRKPLHSLTILLLPALLLPLVRRDPTSLSLWLITVLGVAIIGRYAFLSRYITSVVPLAAVLAALVLMRPAGAVLSMVGIAAMVRLKAQYIAQHSETAAVFGKYGQGIADWIVAWFVALFQPSAAGHADPPAYEHPWLVWLLGAGALGALVVLVLGAFLAARSGDRRLRRRIERMLHRSVIALAVGLLALTALHEYHKLATFVHPMRWLAGDESHLAHLKRVGYNRVTGIVQPIAFMNERYDQGLIAASDRALVVAAVPGELLPLPTLPDGTFVGRRWTAELITAGGDLDLLADRLRQRNVRYIILNMGIMMWQGSVHRVERIETLHTLHTLKQFLDRHAAGPPIYAQDYLIIYELRDASSPR